MDKQYTMIAKTFQGLEEVLAKELTELGANDVEIGRRMVSFSGDKEMMYRANFSLRTAIRILKPIKQFTAKNADEVYNEIKAIEWEEILDVEKTFAIDSVVFSQEFRHSKFVAYKVKDAIVDYFRDLNGKRPSVRIHRPDVLLNIHIAETKCTLSLDSSGESLHRRGYRQEAVEAPLNEVLAAGIILQTGWNGEMDLIDPMCGSGTIPIEAALIARNIAPGIFRKEFAFEKWVDFDQDLFDEIYNDDSQEREFTHKIYGYDNNPAAFHIASHNIKAAGVSKDIELKLQPIQQFEQPEEPAVLITNPPYGERISTNNILELYNVIGERLKHSFAGNTAWVLSYRRECFDQIGLRPSLRLPLFNGPLECEVRKYEIFDGRLKDFKEELNQEGGEMGEEPTDSERKPREERRQSGERREFNRGDRPGGDRRQSGGRREFNRGDRPGGDRRQSGERREFNRGDRPGGDRRQFGGRREFNRGDRPGGNRIQFGERRDFDREDKPTENKSQFGERHVINRGDRPAGERRQFGGRPDLTKGDRPRRRKRFIPDSNKTTPPTSNETNNDKED